MTDYYKGYSLIHWFLDQMSDEENKAIISAYVRGERTIVAASDNLNDLYYMLGLIVLDSAIIECERHSEDNSTWCILIDLDKTGKFGE